MTATWSLEDILRATGGRLVRNRPAAVTGAITIDSRQLAPAEVFVAIRGRRFDGHAFLQEAVARGASCLVVSQWPLDVATTANGHWPSTVLVPDTTVALGELARYHRRRMGIPVIAVTGSCGKTTTKELIAHLLGGPQTVLRTRGTQNNHIGVPLTLLRMSPHHRMAVVELGSNHSGEIARLAAIAEPDVAVLTNIGPAHLEFFGSLTEVLREKLSLLEALPPEGSAVLPGDQLDVCLEAPRRLDPSVRIVTFGTTDRCDIQALDIARSADGFSIRLRDHLEPLAVPLVGHHNVENVVAAIACAWAMGLPLSVARERLASFVSLPLRSQLVRIPGLVILNDCYNANPLSFARALETLRDLEVRRRLAIIGDMLELGTYAEPSHEAIGRLAAQVGIDVVIAVGAYAQAVARGVREARPSGAQSRPSEVLTFRTVQELLQELPAMLQDGDGLLVKGSRKLNLEHVTEFLLHHPREAAGVFAR